MNIYELIKSRSSIRVYKKDPVPLATVEKIVEAAGRAASWGNKQCWRFIIVDSKVEKNLIGKTSGQPNIAKACEDAPYVLVLCANPRESGSKNGMEYYLFDMGLAMENLMLAARHEGLETCIVSWFDERSIKGVLNVPENFRVIAYTPLGFAGEEVLSRPRKKQQEIVFYNQWGKNLPI